MVVIVKALAADPDGDALHYRWIVAPGSGKIDSPTEPEATWQVGQGEGLMLVLTDGRGGQARARLKITEKGKVLFSGLVVSKDGRPIEAADVDVAGVAAKTDTKGLFRLEVTPEKTSRYVLNIRKAGYGLVSRIYGGGVSNGKWVMTKGTVAVVDPRQPIRIRDTGAPSSCQGRLSARIDWSRYPVQKIPNVFNAAGRPLGNDLPPAVSEALRLLEGGTACNPGIQLSLPANALVDASGNPPAGNVEVTLSTADLYSPDGIPGDYSVDVEGRGAYMQSYGAGIVSITAEGKPYQLKSGAVAELTIPVDPTQLKARGRIPSTIPFLRYDETKGLWVVVGTARLNAQGNAYAAVMDHLSAFNTDLVKTNQSCVRIDSSAIPDPYRLEVVIPMPDGAAPVVKTFDIAPDPEHPDNPNIHTIYNLPSQTYIHMTASREEPSGNIVPLGVFVVDTGNPQQPSRPNRPAWDYGACQSRVSLFEVLPGVVYQVDGARRHFGPLPVCIYALADEATGQEIYPIGNGAYYFFGLFDTGSAKVAIYNSLPYSWDNWNPDTQTGDPNGGLDCVNPNRITDANWWYSDASFLGLSGEQTARLRLNGLSTIDSNLNAPIGLGAAQAELTGINVVPRDDTDVTLIGVPVIHRVVAKIDYTKYVEKAGYNFYPNLITNDVGIDGFTRIDKVYGPDITFYLPDDPQIPVPPLSLELGRWGTPERYSLKNVTFKHGAASMSDQDLPYPYIFQYDTGSFITIIGDLLAGQLGLTPNSGTFKVYNPGDGYVLDEVLMTSPNGVYKISKACVCWDQSRIQAAAVVAAVIGSNFFDQVPVLFNGPQNKLGIWPPAKIPVNWQIIPQNCHNNWPGGGP
jgi:hypothetical protein